jgi:hypothetical protein
MYISPANVTLYIYYAYLVIGIAIFFITIIKPDKFWLLMTASIITGSGLEFKGYPIIDEYLVSILFFGLFIRFIFVDKREFLINNKSSLTFHQTIFYILIAYLILQSVRGMFLLEDIRMVRWIVFFITLGLISFLSSNNKYIVYKKQAIIVVFYSSFMYFLLYWYLGYFVSQYSDINRWVLQGTLWTGTSAMLVPLILYLVSAISYIETVSSKKSIFIVLISFVVVYYCVLFYESRSSEFLILGSLACYMFFNLFKVRKLFLIISILLFVLYGFVYSYYVGSFEKASARLVKFIPYNVETYEFELPKVIHLASGRRDGSNQLSTKNSDIDRVLHHTSAFNTMKDANFLTQIFGYGWYKGARYEMNDEILILRQAYGLPTEFVTNGKPVQPTGAVAIFVDTGFLGIFLVLLNILWTIISIQRSKDTNKYTISVIYSTSVLVFFVGNTTPLLLVWLLMMPNSPFLLMLKKESDRNDSL